jgi:hypothetical protein
MVAEESYRSIEPADDAFYALRRILVNTYFYFEKLANDKKSHKLELVIWKPTSGLSSQQTEYPEWSITDQHTQYLEGNITDPGLYIVGLQGSLQGEEKGRTTILEWELRLDYDERKLWHVDLQYTVKRSDQKKKPPTVKYSYGQDLGNFGGIPLSATDTERHKKRQWESFRGALRNLNICHDTIRALVGRSMMEPR